MSAAQVEKTRERNATRAAVFLGVGFAASAGPLGLIVGAALGRYLGYRKEIEG